MCTCSTLHVDFLVWLSAHAAPLCRLCNRYVPQAHFNTDARRLLFDSYAEHVLVPIGVHIWDVYGVAAMGR